jgi:hypothetical protein
VLAMPTVSPVMLIVEYALLLSKFRTANFRWLLNIIFI